MSVLGVIPARFGSTRFPGKPLADIDGKSLIQRVWEQVCSCSLLDNALIATDDERILAHVSEFGGLAELTSAEHQSGTDRLGEIAERHSFDYYVNIQGDEPLLAPAAIDALIETTLAQQAAMSTLVARLDAGLDAVEISDPNVVKVTRAINDNALYFSRSAIPYPRRSKQAAYCKHIGIYMYNRQTLLRLCQLPPTPLELSESLEQLRALEHGIPILTVLTDYNPIGVDTPEDLARVIEHLKGNA